MTAPIWFLDVDGVLNAFPAPKPHQPHAAQFRHVDVPATGPDGELWPFPIWYRPRVVEAVNAVHRRALARVCWLTTWGIEAVTRLAPALGLDEFDCADGDDGTSPRAPTWWKLGAIRERVTPGERFVFTDDSLDRSSCSALRRIYGEDALLIAPLPCGGLTDEHLVRIEEFCVGAPRSPRR